MFYVTSNFKHIFFCKCKHVIMLWLISCCQYFKVNSNEPIKVIHLQKLANQSILNGTYAIEIWQIYQHFISRLKITKTKWKKNFDHLIKREKCFNWKKDIHGLWKYMDFANIEADQTRQRTAKLCVAWPSTKWAWKVKVMLC